MKTYEVELKRTSFVTVTVEAKDTDEAEFIAWQEIPNTHDAEWEIESIQLKPTDDDQTLEAALLMEKMGGSFAASIARAWMNGDSSNKRRVYAAFEDLFEKYHVWVVEDSK